jgi:Cu/Ag efflux protein CusF
MKVSTISASILALGLLTGSGFAASTAPMATSMSDTAAIKTIDAKAHQLTLADGKVFSIPSSWTLKAFKPGEKVRVTYKTSGTTMIVTAVKHVA